MLNGNRGENRFVFQGLERRALDRKGVEQLLFARRKENQQHSPLKGRRLHHAHLIARIASIANVVNDIHIGTPLVGFGEIKIALLKQAHEYNTRHALGLRPKSINGLTRSSFSSSPNRVRPRTRGKLV